MKILRLRRLTLLGVGFLLGSRAGRGPWDKAAATWNTVQAKAESGLRRGGVKEKIEQAKGKLGHSSGGNGVRTPGGNLPARPMTEI